MQGVGITRQTYFSLSLNNGSLYNGFTLQQIQMRVVDDAIGQPFDLQLEDFDNDGKIDLLATAFNDKFLVRSGSVYIYEIPDDLL